MHRVDIAIKSSVRLNTVGVVSLGKSFNGQGKCHIASYWQVELTSTTSLNHLRSKSKNFAQLLQLTPGLKILLGDPLKVQYHHQEGYQKIMMSHSPVLASILDYLHSCR
ncbi:hypothetical protein BD769DRAFT_1394312 [Suillus cothurnatus]|nr:hypothetical protein BD769DRAFT_1394312 [Suillus cothurnatus]